MTGLLLHHSFAVSIDLRTDQLSPHVRVGIQLNYSALSLFPLCACPERTSRSVWGRIEEGGGREGRRDGCKVRNGGRGGREDGGEGRERMEGKGGEGRGGREEMEGRERGWR